MNYWIKYRSVYQNARTRIQQPQGCLDTHTHSPHGANSGSRPWCPLTLVALSAVMIAFWKWKFGTRKSLRSHLADSQIKWLAPFSWSVCVFGWHSWIYIEKCHPASRVDNYGKQLCKCVIIKCWHLCWSFSYLDFNDRYVMVHDINMNPVNMAVRCCSIAYTNVFDVLSQCNG